MYITLYTFPMKGVDLYLIMNLSSILNTSMYADNFYIKARNLSDSFTDILKYL